MAASTATPDQLVIDQPSGSSTSSYRQINNPIDSSSARTVPWMNGIRNLFRADPLKSSFVKDFVTTVDGKRVLHPLVQEALNINEGIVKWQDGVEIALGPTRGVPFYGDESNNPTVKALLNLIVQAEGDQKLQTAIAYVGLFQAIRGFDGSTERPVTWSRQDPGLNEAFARILKTQGFSRQRFRLEWFNQEALDIKASQSLTELGKNQSASIKRGITYSTVNGFRPGSGATIEAENVGLSSRLRLEKSEQLDASLTDYEQRLFRYLREVQSQFFSMVRKAGLEDDPVQAFKAGVTIDLPKWVIARLPDELNGRSTAASAIVGTAEQVNAGKDRLLELLREKLNEIDRDEHTNFANQIGENSVKLSRVALFTSVTDEQETKLQGDYPFLKRVENRAYLIADSAQEAIEVEKKMGESVWSLKASIKAQRDILSRMDPANESEGAKKASDWFEAAADVVESTYENALKQLLLARKTAEPYFGDAQYARGTPDGHMTPLQQVLQVTEGLAIYSLGSDGDGARTRGQLGISLDEAILISRPNGWYKHQPPNAAEIRAEERQRRLKSLSENEQKIVDYYRANKASIDAKGKYEVVLAILDGEPESSTVVEFAKFCDARTALSELSRLERIADSWAERGKKEQFDTAEENVKKQIKHCREKLKEIFPDLTDFKPIKNGMLSCADQKNISPLVAMGVADPNAIGSALGLLKGLQQMEGGVESKVANLGKAYPHWVHAASELGKLAAD